MSKQTQSSRLLAAHTFVLVSYIILELDLSYGLCTRPTITTVIVALTVNMCTEQSI